MSTGMGGTNAHVILEGDRRPQTGPCGFSYLVSDFSQDLQCPGCSDTAATGVSENKFRFGSW